MSILKVRKNSREGISYIDSARTESVKCQVRRREYSAMHSYPEDVFCGGPSPQFCSWFFSNGRKLRGLGYCRGPVVYISESAVEPHLELLMYIHTPDIGGREL